METGPVERSVGFNWKSLRSGLKWIVFSPLMFLWGVMADRTSSNLEYDIQVTLFRGVVCARGHLRHRHHRRRIVGSVCAKSP